MEKGTTTAGAGRERLSSRLGFIMLSAGCAIGCGNIWKFPWMTGQYGGGGFVLIYLVCLALLGLPVMTVEFAIGRAAQASPVRMYQKLERPGQKWHIHGYLCLAGNVGLMAFYTVVTGWMIRYFVGFLTDGGQNLSFAGMVSDPVLNVAYLLVAVTFGFAVLCFDLQGGLERVTKIMMVMLFTLMLALSTRSVALPGAAKGLSFYLLPNLSRINGSVVVAAMNQAFFTLSVGIGAMSIFGSYIGKERALMGESLRVILLDTLVAVMAGFIIFPACYTYGIEPDAGPSLLFETMATVFHHMPAGRFWGTLFFLFMVFAALSTELAVFEGILSCVRELTGLSRPKGCLVCGVAIFLISLTTALGYSVLRFQPFAEGSTWLDFWDFIVSVNLLPIGALIMIIFCSWRIGWGWERFTEEANTGLGIKVRDWMKPMFQYIVPACILVVYLYGLADFSWS